MDIKTENLKNYIDKAIDVLNKLDLEEVLKFVNILEKTRINKGRIYICGNGGSSATASHYANDFNKMVSDGLSPKYDFFCLSDNTPTLMAISNDVSYEECFSYQLDGRITKNDILIAISGSGNSKNIIRAVEEAHKADAIVVGLSGYDGGKLKALSDISMHIDINNMQITEDIHMLIGHMSMSAIINLLHSSK